jgi:Cu(I)/Ag(I) efflux system protein CusF
MKTSMKLFALSAAMTALSLISPSLVLAQTVAATSAAATPNAMPLSEGEIKKVNMDTAQLTIQHGPLTNLHMPGMTMSFKVKDAAMLQQVKPGDKVHMSIEKVDGALTVTTLQKQP